MHEGSFYCFVPKSPAVPSWLLDNPITRTKSEKLVSRKLEELSAKSLSPPKLKDPTGGGFHGSIVDGSGNATVIGNAPIFGALPSEQTYVFPGGGISVRHGVHAVSPEFWRQHPYVHSASGVVVVFYGYLSNLVELLQTLENTADYAALESLGINSYRYDADQYDGNADVVSSTASIVLALYLSVKEGEEIIMLSEMQGQYAFVIYDSNKRHLFVARDPSGREPLYYREEDNGAMSLTNAPNFTETGVRSTWEEVPPGHFFCGKHRKLQQFALTPEQLLSRSLEDDFHDVGFRKSLGSRSSLDRRHGNHPYKHLEVDDDVFSYSP